MISIPGQPGSTCDGWSRREFLRVGGAGLLGISLADILRLQANASSSPQAVKSKSGWGKAKSVIFIFLQGGPRHACAGVPACPRVQNRSLQEGAWHGRFVTKS